MKIVSFDIFDTLISRFFFKSTDLFIECGKRALALKLTNISADSWANNRIQIEVLVRKSSEHEEITLNEIYSKISIKLKLDYATIIQLMAIEIEVEKEFSTPIIENILKLKRYKEKGYTTILTSDMYLSKEVINALLIKHQLVGYFDELFLSSDLRKTKRENTLYKHLASTYKVDAKDILHIGDNMHSDYFSAKSIGLNAILYTESYPNRYERQLYKLTKNRSKSLLAGISKSIRLNKKYDSEKQKIIYEVSASVVAPLIFCFVEWTLRKAIDLKVKKVYFLARDGQLPYKVANILIERWGYDIECFYIYGSRQAWHFPSITDLDDKETQKWILEKTNYTSINTLCERINLNPIEIEQYLTDVGFGKECWVNNLAVNDILKFKQILKLEEVKSKIVKSVALFHDLALRYFNQVGINQNELFLIADIGWNGRLQRSLTRIIKKVDINFVSYGTYFCLERIFKENKNDKIFSFAASPLQKEHHFITSYKAVMELFFAADHGSTISYKETTNGVEPQLRNKLHNTSNWDINWQHDVVLEYANTVSSLIKKDEINFKEFGKISIKNLKTFLQNPNIYEAKIYGSTFIFEDQNEESGFELAPTVKYKDFIKWFLKKEGNLPLACWAEASIIRSDFYFKRLFFALIKFRVVLKTFLTK